MSEPAHDKLTGELFPALAECAAAGIVAALVRQQLAKWRKDKLGTHQYRPEVIEQVRAIGQELERRSSLREEAR